MEREGSGFDLVYERLLASGRSTPIIVEQHDSVIVTVPRRLLHPGVIRLLADASATYHLSQRERITLAMLAQSEGIRAVELAQKLALSDPAALRPWLGRLVELGLVQQTGRTTATRYFVPPELLRGAGLDQRTTLSRIEPHRLKALVVEDLHRYPMSSISDIHRRIGSEIQMRALRRMLDSLLKEGVIEGIGERRWRRYRVKDPIDRDGPPGQ